MTILEAKVYRIGKIAIAKKYNNPSKGLFIGIFFINNPINNIFKKHSKNKKLVYFPVNNLINWFNKTYPSSNFES